MEKIEENEIPLPIPEVPSKKIVIPRLARQKPIDWFAGPFNPVRGERALWVAVITQAMMDALSRSKNSEAAYHKHEATHWLTENGKDFIMVCLMAGFDPDYIRKQSKRALVSPRPWRAEAGKGSRYEERKSYRSRKRAEPAPATENNVIKGHWNPTFKGE